MPIGILILNWFMYSGLVITY